MPSTKTESLLDLLYWVTIQCRYGGHELLTKHKLTSKSLVHYITSSRSPTTNVLWFFVCIALWSSLARNQQREVLFWSGLLILTVNGRCSCSNREFKWKLLKRPSRVLPVNLGQNYLSTFQHRLASITKTSTEVLTRKNLGQSSS